jgi:hypothetical protein
MPFNGPIDGDYSVCDPNKAPWTPEIMTLTHDECITILGKFNVIEEGYKPQEHYGEPISDTYIYTEYNTSDWTYGINFNTYSTLRGYSPEFNTQGINVDGIIPEPEIEEPEEEPIPEEPTEEPTPEEGTTEVVEEAPIEEETTTEIPAE